MNRDNDLAFDETDYYGKFYRNLLKYLDQKIKDDEVLYVDIFNNTPFTPAYANFPCILIDSPYNVSVNRLINKRKIYYKGYVLVHKDPNEDLFYDENDI